jgi:hypothetical protein
LWVPVYHIASTALSAASSHTGSHIEQAHGGVVIDGSPLLIVFP